MGAVGAAVPLDAAQAPCTLAESADARRSSSIRHRAARRTRGQFGNHLRRSRETGADRDERGRPCASGRQLAQAMAPLYERRTGPRKMALEPDLAPATVWNPLLPGVSHPSASGAGGNHFIRSADTHAPLPTNDADIAFASVAQLSRWIEPRQITSETADEHISGSAERFDPKLRCVITLTRDHALEQARQADAEIAAGKYRGPLHGIPWGAKDLLDTAGIPTTYGAEPYRDRVPKKDARGGASG